MLNNFKNILSSSEMRSIKGGNVAPGGSGSCGYKTSDGEKACGVSRATAQSAVSSGGHWCCDSCSSTSYCGNTYNPGDPGNGGGGNSTGVF